jgi:hypothetical protein
MLLAASPRFTGCRLNNPEWRPYANTGITPGKLAWKPALRALPGEDVGLMLANGDRKTQSFPRQAIAVFSRRLANLSQNSFMPDWRRNSDIQSHDFQQTAWTRKGCRKFKERHNAWSRYNLKYVCQIFHLIFFKINLGFCNLFYHHEITRQKYHLPGHHGIFWTRQV